MKSLNKFGYTKMEVLVVAVLLGIVAFITINSTSYAFAIDTAEEYALDNLDLFKEADTNYILVSDLVDNGYMMTNNDGMVTSPDNSGKTFNDNKIKVEYNKDSNKVEATFID